MTTRLRTLTGGDRSRLEQFLARAPVENLFLAAKVNELGLDRRRLGQVHAFERDDDITGVCLDGGTIFVGGHDAEAIPAFVRAIGGMRRATSILGPAMFVLGLYVGLSERYQHSWSTVSNVRRAQPLMVLSGHPLPEPDTRVRRLTQAEFRSYLEASIHMYTEEIGSSPFRYGGGYDSFVKDRLRQGDAWGIVEDGEVIFKADLGPRMPGHAQLQGVWVHPEYRGQGISVPALSAMLLDVQETFPTVSLYVNDFNIAAIKCYERLGFERVGTLATVHY